MSFKYMKYNCVLFPIYLADKMKEAVGHAGRENVNETDNASGCRVSEMSEVIRGLSKAKLTEGAMINKIESSDQRQGLTLSALYKNRCFLRIHKLL